MVRQMSIAAKCVRLSRISPGSWLEILTPYRLDYFIRFYVPSDCAIDDQAYIEWAEMILAMGTASPGSDQGS